MDPQAGNSFIPRKPLNDSGSGGSFGLLFVIALILFVLSLVGAGAAYGYQGLLHKQIADKDESLKLGEGAFEKDLIDVLIRTDLRINETKKLLASHVAASAIFGRLGEITLSKVQLTSMSLELGKDGGAKLSLQGIGDSFSTAALQSDQFGATKFLRNVVFSNVTIGDSGKVSFSVSADVLPGILSYSDLISSGAAPTPNQQEPGSSTQPL